MPCLQERSYLGNVDVFWFGVRTLVCMWVCNCVQAKPTPQRRGRATSVADEVRFQYLLSDKDAHVVVAAVAVIVVSVVLNKELKLAYKKA